MSQVLYCDPVETVSSEGIFGPRGRNENDFRASALARIFFIDTAKGSGTSNTQKGEFSE